MDIQAQDNAVFENDDTNLPTHVKEGIERAKQQTAAGLLTLHDEVMKKYAKYLSK